MGIKIQQAMSQNLGRNRRVSREGVSSGGKKSVLKMLGKIPVNLMQSKACFNTLLCSCRCPLLLHMLGTFPHAEALLRLRRSVQVSFVITLLVFLALTKAKIANPCGYFLYLKCSELVSDS